MVRPKKISVRLSQGELAVLDRERRTAGYRSRAAFIRSRLTAETDLIPLREAVLKMRHLAVLFKESPSAASVQALEIFRKVLEAVNRR
jgi:hypothetical protein